MNDDKPHPNIALHHEWTLGKPNTPRTDELSATVQNQNWGFRDMQILAGKLEAELDAANAALNRAKYKAICLYCQKEFNYKTGEGQAALADHICTCDMNPLIKGCNAIVAAADELYRLVEAYLCTPNTDPVIEDHYKALVAWFVRSKRPDGTEPRPVAPEQTLL